MAPVAIITNPKFIDKKIKMEEGGNGEQPKGGGRPPRALKPRVLLGGGPPKW